METVKAVALAEQQKVQGSNACCRTILGISELQTRLEASAIDLLL